MFAVVQIGSSQHLVSPGQEVTVDYQGPTSSPTATFDRVYLVVDGQSILIGQPTVASIVVQAEILDHPKSPKIRVAKFKAKSRYRKVKGFRALQTRLRISHIGPAKPHAREIKN